jgi:hypothetical protein
MQLTNDSGVWKPAGINDSKKLAGPCELDHISLKTGGTAGFVSIYDAADSSGATPSNLKWQLDASTTVPDNEQLNGLVFKKGIFAIVEQGDANLSVCYAIRKYTTN